MNPSVGGWNNPPPPGTEAPHEDDDEHSSASSKTKSAPAEDLIHKLRGIDRIDPYLKNPEYVEYEKRVHTRDRERSRHRRRSRSKSEKERKSKDIKRRSRSKSRDRYRRSRSRHRHRYRSYSRSPSTSRSKYGKSSKKDKRHRRSSSRTRKYSRSHSRSHSRSRSRRGRRRSRPRHSRGHDELRSGSEDKDDALNTSGEMDDDDEPAAKENAFKNDGSFLEMFKKMQEEKAAEAAKEQASGSEIKKPMPAFGKRRGGRILKTGLVEKTKIKEECPQSEGLDAWSVYMKEVKRYKEACCDDDSKTRPLVK